MDSEPTFRKMVYYHLKNSDGMRGNYGKHGN